MKRLIVRLACYILWKYDKTVNLGVLIDGRLIIKIDDSPVTIVRFTPDDLQHLTDCMKDIYKESNVLPFRKNAIQPLNNC